MSEDPFHPEEFSEEDFEPTPKPEGRLSHRPPAAALWPAALCFLGFVIVSGLYWQRGDVSQLFWVSRESVFERGEYWRLLSALFTHSDFGHLLSNTPLFLIFGWALYGYFGFWVFPVLSFSIGVLSNLWTISYYPEGTRLVGASGMLYGMVGLWLVLYIRFDVERSVFWRVFRAIGFALIVIFPTTFHPHVSYLAHGLGLVLGIAAGLVAARFLPAPPPSTPPASTNEEPYTGYLH